MGDRAFRVFAAIFEEAWTQEATADVPAFYIGLIGPGDRTSIEPMAERFAPGKCDRLHQFISHGLWDVAPLETELALQADRIAGASDAFLVIGDTGLPKKAITRSGRAAIVLDAGQESKLPDASVGDACARRGSVPVGLRLFLPDSWIGDQKRMAKAGVRDGMRISRTKPGIALAEIDRLIVTGVRYGSAG